MANRSSRSTRDPRVLALVLAGGEGKRLAPLTADRAKPAVPFGGHYRLIDFVLSNLTNAGYVKILVLTQYKSNSLNLHIARTWRLSAPLAGYVSLVPAQMRRGPEWFQGSADAIYQSFDLIEQERPDYICVFGADHVYRMDPRQMVDQHIDTGAGVTVAGVRMPREDATGAGVIEPAEGTAIRTFKEKPSDPEGLPDDPEHVLASMGNYVFTAETLAEAVRVDTGNEDSEHDVGGDLVPMLVDEGVAHVYDFGENEVPGESGRELGYWRDVGTLDALHESHLDLLGAEPRFSLDNPRWPIHTTAPSLPPARFVYEGVEGSGRVLDSLICSGASVIGATVESSVLSPGVVVRSHARAEQSVVMHDVVIGEGAVVRNAILDKDVEVKAGTSIGVDADADRERFAVSDNGIIVVAKGEKIS